MKELITKSLNYSVLVTNDKNEEYSYVKKEKALDYNFIRLGNEYFIPAISIDIDNVNPFEDKDPIEVFTELKIPLPTMIVKTTRGFHIHWFLQNPIKTSNYKQTQKLNFILNALADKLGADIHAKAASAGRVWRNPLKHSTMEFGHTIKSLYEFDDLLATYEVKKKTFKKVKSRKRVFVAKKDVIKAKKGERNVKMFDYLRKWAYRNFRNIGLDGLVAEAYSTLEKMENPLPKKEVESIVASINKFMITKYVNRTTNERTIAFNRMLAQRKKDKTIRKIIEAISANMLTIKQIRNMSVRELAKLTGISKSSAAKYKKIIKDILMLLLGAKDNKDIDFDRLSYALLDKFLSDLTGEAFAEDFDEAMAHIMGFDSYYEYYEFEKERKKRETQELIEKASKALEEQFI